METHQSHRDDMFNNSMNHPTQKKLNYDTKKNNIAPIWIPSFTINMSYLRDLRWVSGSFFSINISSLREYIKKSRRDGMFIEPGIQSFINKSRRDDMFITPWRTTTHQQSRRDEMCVKTIQHINHSTNSPLNHIPFHQPTPTYARIL